jgi:multidrug efflux pump subunit AcrB
LAAKRLSRKLDRLAGIKKVEIMGARQEIVQVRLIPERLQSFGGTNATVDGRSAAFCGLD